MYYTDSEIYHKLRCGVEASVLAQLNGSSVKEIRAAERRYAAEIAFKDAKYRQFMDRQEARKKMASVVEITKVAETKEEPVMAERKERFKYTKEMLAQIDAWLKEGRPIKSIYDELFSDNPNAPTYKGFYVRCKKRFDELAFGTKDSADDPGEKDDAGVIDKLDIKDIHSLRETRTNLLNRIDNLNKQYQNALYELARLDIKIEELSK